MDNSNTKSVPEMNLVGACAYAVQLAEVLAKLLQQHGHIDAPPADVQALLKAAEDAVTKQAASPSAAPLKPMKLCVELELSDDAEGKAIFGFSQNGMFIVEPHLDSSGRFPVAASEYGISEDEANFLEGLNQAIGNATDAAINAGVLAIQQALGVSDGGYAGVHFSGDESDKVRRIFAEYLKGEITVGEAVPKG